MNIEKDYRFTSKGIYKYFNNISYLKNDDDNINILTVSDKDKSIKELNKFKDLKILNLYISKVIEDDLNLMYSNIIGIRIDTYNVKCINDMFVFNKLKLHDNLKALRIEGRYKVNNYLDIIQLPTKLKVLIIDNPVLSYGTSHNDTIKYLYERCKRLKYLSIQLTDNRYSPYEHSITINDFEYLKELSISYSGEVIIKDMYRLEELYVVASNDIIIHNLPSLSRLQVSTHERTRLYNIYSIDKLCINYHLNIDSNNCIDVDNLQLNYIQSCNDDSYNPKVFGNVSIVDIVQCNFNTIEKHILRHIPILNKLYIKLSIGELRSNYVLDGYKFLKELFIIVDCDELDDDDEVIKRKFILSNVPLLTKVSVIHTYTNKKILTIESDRELKLVEESLDKY